MSSSFLYDSSSQGGQRPRQDFVLNPVMPGNAAVPLPTGSHPAHARSAPSQPIPPSYVVYPTTELHYQDPQNHNIHRQVAIPPPPGTLNPRSCVTCRQRKVRCDKRMPCGNCCRKRVPCIFPPPGRAPRRPRPRDPNAPPPKSSSQREIELRTRLRKLEAIVKDLSGQLEIESASGSSGKDGGQSADSPGHGTMSTGPRDRNPTPAPEKADGGEDVEFSLGRLVIHEQGKTRYISSNLWMRLDSLVKSLAQDTDELADYSSADETGDETSPEALLDHDDNPPLDHHAFILGYSSAAIDLSRFHYPPVVLRKVWALYHATVEPVIKVLHRPSMEVMLDSVNWDGRMVSPGNEALLFTIYYAVVVAAGPKEASNLLGLPHVTLLAQYRFALEQGLAKAGFILSSELVVFQALIIYINVVQAHDGTRFNWAMSGLITHLAKGVGLHRDGSNFGLSPFESEIRRRIWWNICGLDLRTGESQGTELIVNSKQDTRLPLNLADDDFGPDSTELPKPRLGFTESSMAISRFQMYFHIHRLMRASHPNEDHLQFSVHDGWPKDMRADTPRRLFLKIHRDVIGDFPSIDDEPLRVAASMAIRIIEAKIRSHNHWKAIADDPTAGEVQHDALAATSESLVYTHTILSDPRQSGWWWLYWSFPQWDAVAYVLTGLVKQPWSSASELMWTAASWFHTAAANANDPDNGSEKSAFSKIKYWSDILSHTPMKLPLLRMFARARRYRAAELARLRADHEAAIAVEVERQALWGKSFEGVDGHVELARSRWMSEVGLCNDDGRERGGRQNEDEKEEEDDDDDEYDEEGGREERRGETSGHVNMDIRTARVDQEASAGSETECGGGTDSGEGETGVEAGESGTINRPRQANPKTLSLMQQQPQQQQLPTPQAEEQKYYTMSMYGLDWTQLGASSTNSSLFPEASQPLMQQQQQQPSMANVPMAVHGGASQFGMAGTGQQQNFDYSQITPSAESEHGQAQAQFSPQQHMVGPASRQGEGDAQTQWMWQEGDVVVGAAGPADLADQQLAQQMGVGDMTMDLNLDNIDWAEWQRKTSGDWPR